MADETAEQTKKTCPCCGQEIPLGLFDRVAVCNQPTIVEALAMTSELDVDVPVTPALEMVQVNGRFFLSAKASLPLSWIESPVRAVVWLEISVEASEVIEEMRMTGHGNFYAEGRLACEFPGFTGSLGAAVEFSISAEQSRAQVHAINDDRFHLMAHEPTHEQLIDLYRRMWGRRQPVAPANLELRAAVGKHLRQLIGRPSFRKPVKPLAPIAGIRPTEVLIAPPEDTGQEAILATIGASDSPSAQGNRVELMSWIKDPGDKFISSFGEFANMTRMTENDFAHGDIIPDRRPLPESTDMSAWLVAKPWWIEEQDLLTPSLAGHEVQILAAIPIYGVEAAIVNGMGPEALINLFQSTDADVTDLHREPVFDPGPAGKNL